MLQIAFYLSCGATVCYLWGRSIKGKADSFSSITRVVDFKRLDDLLKVKATNLLVAVSGKVGSATPFNCKHENDSSSGDVFEAKVEMGYETKLDDDVSGLVIKSHNILLHRKEAPWYLEDSTGLVKVVGAEFADGFIDALKPRFVISANDFFQWFGKPQEGSKVILRAALDTGTSLTVVGEAARDEAGNLTIHEPNEQSLMVFCGEGSFDKMVGNLKSNSEFFFFYSKIFGTIAVAIAVMRGVAFIRSVLRERSERADSDNEENP